MTQPNESRPLLASPSRTDVVQAESTRTNSPTAVSEQTAPLPTSAVTVTTAKYLAPAFLASLVGTVILSYATPLLGAFQTKYDVSASRVAWVSVVISLSAVGSLATFPRLGDRFGHRLVISWVLGLITVGAAVSATSNSFAVALIGLGLQATGGCLASLGAGLIRRHVDGDRLGRGLGLLNVAAGVGNGGGFLLGGIILRSSTLDTLFWCIGGGALALLVVVQVVAPRHHVRHEGRINIVGTALLMVWLVALILGLGRGDTWGWHSPRTLTCLIAGPVLLIAWLIHETRSTAPVVDLRFVRQRMNGMSMLLICLAGVCTNLIATMVVISRSLPPPFGPGDSVLAIAVLLLLNGAGIAAAAPVAGALTPRIGSRPIAAAGLLVLVIASAWLAARHDSRADIMVGVLLLGLATGAVWSTLLVGLVERAGDHAGAVGGSLQDISIQLGFAFAGPINVAVLAAKAVAGTHGQVPADSVFTTGFTISAIVAACALPLTLLLGRTHDATTERNSAGA